MAAVRGVAREAADLEDLTQEVFLRLCKDGFRLFEPMIRRGPGSRPGSRSWHAAPRATRLRRRRPLAVPLDAVPEAQLLATADEPVRKLKLPEELLSPRQREILSMLYDRDMEIAEIAAALGIDPQTVRSTHHKAMIKLRAYFKAEAE